MWNQYWIPLLMPTLIVKSKADDNNTDTVFVRGGGHADVEYLRQVPTTTTTTPSTTTTVATTTTQKIEETTASFFEEEKEDVVFVPNVEPPVTRDENEFDARGLRIKDIMNLKTVNDAMDKDFREEKKEDNAAGDIVFISGKNYDNDDTEPEEKPRRRKGHSNPYKGYDQNDEKGEVVTEKPKLNCNNLDCNNTVQSICGAKLMNNEWRYRLFLNDCFFRKVNCGFNYEINRYIQVKNDKCKNIGSHIEKPFSYKPKPYVFKPDFKQMQNDARRSSSLRRSMTKDFDGDICSHLCPVKCTEDYDPQCALSETGQRRVFLNHCKLDLNSCAYSVVWQKRPLSECVGGKKADMRQNRGFIGWMQRVGIVDRRGRLVLE